MARRNARGGGARKTSGRPLSSFSYLKCYFLLLTRPGMFKTVYPFLGTVIKDFFAAQFLAKWKLSRVHVVNVQSPVDDLIPFVPSKVEVYLRFINYWLQPLSMLIARWGMKRAMPACREFISLVRRCYLEASRVYRVRLSTTDRPACRERGFRMIHFFDPHLMCVPSLHISIIALCLSYFQKKILAQDDFSDGDRAMWGDELQTEAVAIAESVLFIKQHSVHCVSAALYMMTRITDGLFTDSDARDFLGRLFRGNEIPGENSKAAVDYMLSLFNRFSDEGRRASEWHEPLVRWLVEYESRAQN